MALDVVLEVARHDARGARYGVEPMTTFKYAALVAMLIAGPAHAMDAVKSSKCLGEANKVAAATGATIQRITAAEEVIMFHWAASGITYGCPPNPNLFISWEDIAPPPATVNLIVAGSHFITGAPEALIRKELANCIAAALKPESGGYADSHAIPMVCNAIAVAGGGGHVICGIRAVNFR
jgi:hypothetical protein